MHAVSQQPGWGGRHPRHRRTSGGSWFPSPAGRLLGVGAGLSPGQDRGAEPQRSAELSPEAETESPPSPRFSKMKRAQVRRGFPPRKSQRRPAPLPSQADTQRGAVSHAEGGISGGCLGLSLLPPKAP